jgi:hypothetical protein
MPIGARWRALKRRGEKNPRRHRSGWRFRRSGDAEVVVVMGRKGAAPKAGLSSGAGARSTRLSGGSTGNGALQQEGYQNAIGVSAKTLHDRR